MYYPLLLEPSVKDYVWGGTRLISEFGYKGGKTAAEAWVLSCHGDGPSVIKNGKMRGKTLNQAISFWGKQSIGKKPPFSPIFGTDKAD